MPGPHATQSPADVRTSHGAQEERRARLEAAHCSVMAATTSATNKSERRESISVMAAARAQEGENECHGGPWWGRTNQNAC